MYQPTDLKKGVIVQLDGKPYRVVDYNQKVMGRGGSIVNVRLKNLIDGSVLPKTFKGQDKIEPAEVSTQSVQYLYNDGDTFYFMDPTSFEQFELAADLVDSAKDYLKEGDTLSLQFFDGKVINCRATKKPLPPGDLYRRCCKKVTQPVACLRMRRWRQALSSRCQPLLRRATLFLSTLQAESIASARNSALRAHESRSHRVYTQK